MDTSFYLSPVEDETDAGAVSTSDKAATICGLLKYVADSDGVFLFKGVAGGQIICNFSRGGRIASRMQHSVIKGAEYTYDTKRHRFELGFTCL